MNSNCSNLFSLRNLQEQVKKAFCYQKLFWPFTVQTNCSSDRENLNTVGQNNFGNKEYLMRSWLFFYRYILLLQFFFAVQKKFPNLRCIFSLARCFFLWFLFLCLKGGLFLWYFVDIKWQKLDHKRQIMYWKRRCKVHKVFGSKMQCYWKFCWPTQN